MNSRSMTAVRQAAKEEALFSCVRTSSRPDKPRSAGLTEIRGPYYTPMGLYYLQDLLGGMGQAVDGFKFVGARPFPFSALARTRRCFGA